TRRPVTGLLVLEVAVERTLTERCTASLVVRSSLAAPHVLTDATARRLNVGPKGRQDSVAAFDDHLFVVALLGNKRHRRDKQYPHESKVHEAHGQHLPEAIANSGGGGRGQGGGRPARLRREGFGGLGGW